MIEQPPPTIQTTVFLLVFLVVYGAILAAKAVRNTIDLYDLLLLTSVAVVPAAFVLFPRVFGSLSRLVGVAFPFVILFGMLLFIIFVFLIRLVIKTNECHRKITTLIQEVAIVENEVREGRNAASTVPKG